MKKLITLFAIALAVGVSSCSKFDDTAIWDKLNEQEQTLNDHEKRIAALEELCKQMNTNINALQTLVEALEKRDYITNVSPVREDGVVVGYTISFASSDTITIYNGKDGSDGTGGYTPQIGVKKDADGLYYWTLDGEWLLDDSGNKIKAVGEDGRDGQDGTDGTNGSNGSNGQDGQDGEDGTDGRDGVDGITPRLKIENDYWYVSYDEGATWIELGRATGEDGADGSDGSDGEDGDSIFSSVTQDEEYVYFNLADGTMITLPKHDKENIQFEDLQVKAICCKNWDTNNDGELSYAEAAAVTDIGTVFKGNTEIIAFTEFRYFTELGFIAEDAFNGCSNLWKVVLPENMESIGSSAFYGCSCLQTINIPSKIISVEGNAFKNCKISRVTINNLYSWCNIQFASPTSNPLHNGAALYNGNNIITELDFSVAGITHIPSYSFYGCKNLTRVNIHKDIESIGERAFYNCTGEITINNKIIEIDYTTSTSIKDSDDHPFYGSKFSLVTIGNEVQSIGDYAFYYYDSLQKLVIPNTLNSIGKYAFYYCNNLLNVIFSSTPSSNDSLSFESGCFRYCSSLAALPIHNGIITIHSEAFSNCISITAVTINDNIQFDGDGSSFPYFFSGTSGELTVNCSNIPSYAFYDGEFSKIILTDNVSTIGSKAFQSCDKITEIIIPDSVTRIETEAFYNCGTLTKVIIGENVSWIGYRAFYNSNKMLSAVYCKALTPPSLGSDAFLRAANNYVFLIYVPTNSVASYKTATGWSQYQNYIIAYDFE